jgi:hypothetical protein
MKNPHSLPFLTKKIIVYEKANSLLLDPVCGCGIGAAV